MMIFMSRCIGDITWYVLKVAELIFNTISTIIKNLSHQHWERLGKKLHEYYEQRYNLNNIIPQVLNVVQLFLIIFQLSVRFLTPSFTTAATLMNLNTCESLPRFLLSTVDVTGCELELTGRSSVSFQDFLCLALQLLVMYICKNVVSEKNLFPGISNPLIHRSIRDFIT